MKRFALALVVAFAVLFGATAAAAAQPGNQHAADGDGPPVELPEPVPEFVTELLDTITDFVTGVIGALGEAVRTVVSDVGDVAPGVPSHVH
ncbi:hypothetical protein GS429_00985 [Natronorubrum sp. JWXQ-INN-674]|uniref:Uncharacterized protein n=1 Tax=Natronorubrum halalkaliphilum TaxID=2691917 RepID=A0A6B0VHY0_9EURY|nr:hypothetical protein [Natronorubrum halalkaliphilum]MXV60665.1 hypothetical protein [Natronorubrum halalkaliphilum]